MIRMQPVTPDTLPIWAQLEADLHNDPSPQALMAEAILNGEERFLCLEDDAPIGIIDLSTRNDYVEGTDSSPVGYVEGIYVVPEKRGQGVARQMISFAINWCREKGFSELASDAGIENQISIDFHSAVGFQEAGRNVHFVMRLG